MTSNAVLKNADHARYWTQHAGEGKATGVALIPVSLCPTFVLSTVVTSHVCRLQLSPVVRCLVEETLTK